MGVNRGHMAGYASCRSTSLFCHFSTVKFFCHTFHVWPLHSDSQDSALHLLERVIRV